MGRGCAKTALRISESSDDGALDREGFALTLIATQERVRGGVSVSEAGEAWSAGLAGEIRAYAAQTLIARIIAPIPKMRITRFRL
jgi:hypothetical protein